MQSLGTLMVLCSYGPGAYSYIRKIVQYILSFAVATVTIYDNDLGYDALHDRLAQLTTWNNATSYLAESYLEGGQNDWDNSTDEDDQDRAEEAVHSFGFTPQGGIEIFWHKGLPIYLTRKLAASNRGGAGDRDRDSITMRCLGLKPGVIEDFMKGASALSFYSKD